LAAKGLIGEPGRATVLVGFMGAGKTTVARALGGGSLDSDALVEASAGASVAELFDRDGEAAFRELEERVALEALDRAAGGEGGGIVSLGGGALGSARLREALGAHTVVLLDADAEDCWSRVRGSSRPLAADRDSFMDLFAAREAVYLEVADAIVPASGAHSVRAALPAVRALGGAPSGSVMIWAEAASGAYPVFVGRELLAVGSLRPEGRAALVTDTNVGPLHGRAFSGMLTSIELEPGESAKNIDACARAWSELASAGMTRDDQVFALGGGVVGDLAGFVAAAYQRGVPVVHFPTTLVAQVDSSLGGKTGVDLPEGKNYVGAYHQPSAVISDFTALSTLPAQEMSAGMAEVIKTALLAGGSLWESVAAGQELDERVIVECARTKIRVVASDERDGGRRQLLNLGHTVGHAIETETGYSRFRHGEAVAIGLMVALRLSGADRLRDQVGELLRSAGLPVDAVGLDPERIVEVVRADKKARADGTIPFVLCEAPGRATHGNEIPRDELLGAVTEVCR